MTTKISGLKQLLISAVVALALIMTVGVQQGQAQEMGYCCTGNVTELTAEFPVCKVVYTEKYPYTKAILTNNSEDFEYVENDLGYEDVIWLEPGQSQEVELVQEEGYEEIFFLDGFGPVEFSCEK
ncbi:MAG: hypothetical protein F6K41_23145 [Symploca sp. SIO3E6]|nr:hypothetical protein [Caldora sp. SIO3E6]